MTYYGERQRGRRATSRRTASTCCRATRSTCRTPGGCSARRGVHVYQLAARSGLEYWVFNLAPRRHLRACTKRSSEPRHPHGAGVGDRPLASSCRQRCSGYGAPGNTQLSRSYGRVLARPLEGSDARLPLRPGRARRILDQAGWRLGPDGVRARAACARRSSSRTRACRARGAPSRLIRAWARDVGIEIDLRVYDTAKLLDLEYHHGRQRQAQPDFDTELWSIGGDPTPEFLLSLFTKAQLGVWNDSGFVDTRYEQLYEQRDTGEPTSRARESLPSTSSSASRPSTCPTSSCTRPTTSGPSTRAPGRTGRRSRRRTASRSPPSATTRSSR